MDMNIERKLSSKPNIEWLVLGRIDADRNKSILIEKR
jgi:hypothetical protein